jgi:hypothetical protein
VVYFFLSLVDDALKLVDRGMGFCELLLANGGVSADGGDEPEGDGSGSAVDIVVFVTCDHAEEGLGHARRDWWVWAPVGEADMERGQFGNFLHR